MSKQSSTVPVKFDPANASYVLVTGKLPVGAKVTYDGRPLKLGQWNRLQKGSKG